ncbi:MAG TPA: YceI family protein [Actinomycetota bacterium]|jgi:polyisoprenoid-binding protein YceI|nr:YceI family protein [Actinomycetota bacterium]
MNRGGPRWAKLAISAFVLLVVAAVGGPYVYIHFVEGKAPAPLSVNTSTSPAAATSPPASSSSASSSETSSGSIDGTWNVGSGSVVGYRVHETLLGQSNTATGRTTSVTGSLTVAGDTVTAGSFSADLTTVASDKSQRDHQFQGRIMNTATYPTATFKLTQPIALGSEPADGVTVTKQATGDLALHGVTRSITFTVSVKKTGSTIAASGSVPIVFADYNIANPSYAGTVTTDDHGTLEFLLNFTRS